MDTINKLTHETEGMEDSKIYKEVYTYTIKKEIFESNVAEFNGKVYWILTPKKVK